MFRVPHLFVQKPDMLRTVHEEGTSSFSTQVLPGATSELSQCEIAFSLGAWSWHSEESFSIALGIVCLDVELLVAGMENRKHAGGQMQSKSDFIKILLQLLLQNFC